MPGQRSAKAPQLYSVTRGVHTLYLRGREALTKIDRIRVTSEATAEWIEVASPNTSSEEDGSCGALGIEFLLLWLLRRRRPVLPKHTS